VRDAQTDADTMILECIEPVPGHVLLRMKLLVHH